MQHLIFQASGPVHHAHSKAVMTSVLPGWLQGGDWIVTSGGGKKFEDVDLSEKEWCEYCEKSDASVGIYGLESKFEVHRG